MAVLSTIIAAIGVAAAVAGVGATIYASQQQASAQKKAIAAQQQAEAARKRAMELDAQRQRRQQIREAQVKRYQALAIANAQGAQGGSGIEGAYGQISGQSGTNILGINQNEELGGRIFDANAAKGQADMQYASAGGIAGAGAGLSSLGGALVKNSGTIGQIGTYFSGGYA